MAKRCPDEEAEESLPVKRMPLPPKGSGHWSQGLLASMEDPELIVKSDEKCVTIKDRYPKAQYHFLILPKENISSIRSLNSSHVNLLEHILKCGQNLVSELSCVNPKLHFRLGYHAVPSMSRLHMHIISQDFNSPCLKNKKHWNSFTSDFFIDAEKIIEMIKLKNKVELNSEHYEALLKQPLRCHVCHREQKNMPQLKEHIRSHNK